MTEGPPPPASAGTSGASPFDDQGRLVRGGPAGRRAASRAATETPPGVAGGTGPGGVPGTAPLEAPSTRATSVPGAYGGRPADGPAPLAWARSEPIPFGLTGPFALTGGLALGRQRRKRPTVSGLDPVVRGRGLARLSR
ncbi:MAG TPA: hypothetical protein VI248_18590, partial [Kineosporiaceae bacterium]